MKDINKYINNHNNHNNRNKIETRFLLNFKIVKIKYKKKHYKILIKIIKLLIKFFNIKYLQRMKKAIKLNLMKNKV